jgi:hypothetical protein
MVILRHGCPPVAEIGPCRSREEGQYQQMEEHTQYKLGVRWGHGPMLEVQGTRRTILIICGVNK